MQAIIPRTTLVHRGGTIGVVLVLHELFLSSQARTSKILHKLKKTRKRKKDPLSPRSPSLPQDTLSWSVILTT